MPGSLQEIVLTGGPCAGKTTSLCHLEEKLQNNGYRVFSVPEAATRLIHPGIPDLGEIARNNQELYVEIQRCILLKSLEERRHYQKLAQLFVDQGNKAVIIYDRGIMDGQAYLNHSLFASLLEEENISLPQARDSYDGIFHLVTAAEGAEEFYTLENNAARKETAEQARILCQETQQAWVGTPHLRIIDNSAGFENKIKRLEQAVYRIIGIPVPLEIEKKYLLAATPPLTNLRPVQTVDIEQMYILTPEGQEMRIRKRSQNGSALYYLTNKKTLRAGVRVETEKKISSLDYLRLSQQRDQSTGIIKKHRHCFIYNAQYFELDTFIEPQNWAGLALLEIELTEENDQVTLPPGIQIVREVTGDKNFSNHSIAKRADQSVEENLMHAKK